MQTREGTKQEFLTKRDRHFKAIVFDLDGTLLNTLPDLVSLTNAVLKEQGYPTHTMEEIRSYVGNGVHALMVQAVPEGLSEKQVDDAMDRWKELYPQYGHRQTKPYEGMPETLEALKGEGIKLGALSNKFDAAAREVIASFYPGVFDIAHGESPDYPRKPDPTGLFKMIEFLKVDKDEIAYVGDSGGDMVTAKAAGVMAIGVSWGYQPVSLLWEKGADVVVDEPGELAEIVLANRN